MQRRINVGDPVILAIPEDGRSANAATGATKRMRERNGERFTVKTVLGQQYTLDGYESQYGIPYTVLDEWLIYDIETVREKTKAADADMYEWMRRYMNENR